jgi:hypothetical protein
MVLPYAFLNFITKARLQKKHNAYSVLWYIGYHRNRSVGDLVA